jgi:Mrp family chromosome partitioning ATPase
VTVPVGRRRAQLEQRVRTASGATHVVAALPDASDETPPARIIALCSPSDAEENVDVALGLAATLGAAGQETVLVDVEPARKLTRALGLGGAAGIDSLAQTSEVAVDSVRTAIGLPGVSVVPGGSGPVPNTDGAAKILQRLINEVDRVILVTGSPRHNAVSLQWTRAADVSLLVATSGRSKRSDLEEAAHSLRLAGTKLAGTVLRVSGRHVG